MTKCQTLLHVLLSLCLVVALGCGAKNPNAPGSLSGSVTYNGQPLKGGNLVFHPKSGGSFSIGIKSDGTYVGSDLTVSEGVVTVDNESLNPDRKTPSYGGKKGAGMPEYLPPGAPPDAGKKGDASSYVKIPAKYTDPKTSPLTFTITKGKQSKDFALTD